MKLQKHAETLMQLHDLVRKQAEAQHVTGVPGKDTKITSVKGKDTVNKEQVGSPEKHEQGYEQKPSTDASKPVANAKSAEDLGNEVLNLVKEEQTKDAESKATGVPGKDTGITSVKGKDTVNKEQVGSPEKHEQGYEQKPSKDPSKPANAKSAEEIAKEEDEDTKTKVASFELGRQLAVEFIKSAAKANEQTDVIKEAGRKDFDTMVALASEQLQKEEEQVKLAEAQGAQAFDEVLKEAMVANLIEENKQLKEAAAKKPEVKEEPVKVEAPKAEVPKSAEVDAEKIASVVTAKVLEALKNASAPAK